jgi:hypothetical protein
MASLSFWAMIPPRPVASAIWYTGKKRKKKKGKKKTHFPSL